MTFPILGGNGAVGGYAIDNSLRLNQSDNPRLTRTPSSQGNPRTFTFSCWAKKSSNGTRQVLFGADIPSQANASYIRFTDDDTLQAYFDYGNNTLEANLNSVAKFRDLSAFYHVVWATDTTLSTEQDRIKIYVNGLQITDFQSPDYISQNFGTDINQTHPHYVGTDTVGVANDFSLNGYMAEVHFIDGQQLSPTDFGEFDEDSGIWKPISYSGTYGTNGFYLDFENSGSLGADQSGNGNNFTPTNLASTDQTTDTPTNNFATLSPLLTDTNNTTFSEGNCKNVNTNASSAGASIAVDSGKWYCEMICTAKTATNAMIGISTVDGFDGERQLNESLNGGSGLGYVMNGNLTGGISYGATWAVNDVMGIALDLDSAQNTITFYKNGVSQGAVNIDNKLYVFTNSNGQGSSTITYSNNFGNPPHSISSGNSDDNGYGNFEYAPPSGYLALCTQNLATELSPTIDDGSQYFHTQLYTGTGVARSVTNDANAGDFQPDWLWIKVRDNPNNHRLFDTSRGEGVNGYYDLISNATSAEEDGGRVTAISSNGFTVSSNSEVNRNTSPIVSWQWKASGGSTSSNTDGDITTTVQASTTSGFSIVSWNEGAIGTPVVVGHGLGGTPEMIILKRRDGVSNWHTWHQGLGDGNNYLLLNTTGAKNNDSYEYISNIGSSTVQIQGGPHQYDVISYFFRGIEGYSKFGSWEGNNSNDGTFVYTSFKPAFILLKNIDYTGTGWGMFDSKRSPYNPLDTYLLANSSAADSGGTDRVDFLSNGFKWRNNALAWNGSYSYIYMAFAENPFVSSTGIPVTAR